MNNKIKILYVDDEPINLKLLELNLKKHYQILTALNGPAGLETLAKNPDTSVVISDLKMPEMNGIEFIKRAKYRYAHMKFYILTGFDVSDEIQQAIDSHMILQYFQKPFDIPSIQKAINESIEN